MRRGLIPVDVHAGLEPIMAIVLIAGPWIFGFSDVGSARREVSKPDQAETHLEPFRGRIVGH